MGNIEFQHPNIPGAIFLYCLINENDIINDICMQNRSQTAILAEKWKNCVFLRVKFAQYLRYVLHQGCERIEISVECFSLGQSITY